MEWDMNDKTHYWIKLEENTAPGGELDRKIEARDTKAFVVPQEALKRKMVIGQWLFYLSFLPIVAGLGGCVELALKGATLWGVLIFILGIVATIVLSRIFYYRNQKLVKYSLVREIIRQYFNPDIYLAYKRIPDALIDETDVVDDYQHASVSDYFSGTWRDVHFQFGDLTIRGGGKAAHNHKLFTGQLFIIETGLALETPVTIRERKEPISAELYEGRKNSDRFFKTGNETFDRQFDVQTTCRNQIDSRTEEVGINQIQEIHDIVDVIAQDIIEADAFAVSQTTMRFVGNRLYLCIENERDSFELVSGDVNHLEIVKQRVDEEVQGMTVYLDLVMKCLDKIKKRS